MLYRPKYLTMPTQEDRLRGGLLFTQMEQNIYDDKLNTQLREGVWDEKTDIHIGTIKNYDPNLATKYENYSTNRAANATLHQISANSLADKSKIKLGNVTLTVTDPYGIRHFAGREGQHSTGIDFCTSDGNAYALSDMTIQSVQVQKVKGFPDGAIMKPTEGQSAGFYIIAKNSDGTMSQYMHLNPMTKDEMNSLVGKKLKRGDKLWGYNIGSGSMTGPHVKYRVYSGNQNNHIDPSDYIRGLK